MGRLEDILPNFSEMSDEELLERVRDVRQDRMVSKKAHRTTTPKSRKKKAESIKDLLGELSPEERLTLLKGLTK